MQRCLFMFSVRKMQTKDFARAAELANTMNWHMMPADFAFNALLEPEGCLVLLDGAEVVGAATCITYGSVGWFGNLIMEESRRHQGAGTVLVSHALGFLKNKVAASVGLYAYPHLKDFYGMLGFKPDAEFVVLKADAVSAPREIQDNLKALKKEDLTAVVNLDRACFGGSRKKLLSLILGEPKNRGYLALEDDKPVAFAAAKVFVGSAEVGPLVCPTNQQKTAQQLLKAVLQNLEGLEAYMYVPAAQTALTKTALACGFKEDFRLLRMFWGFSSARNCLYLAESLERG
jgi:hypothetical protein